MLPVPRTTLYLGLALILALAAIGYNYQRGEKYRERAEAAESRVVLLVSDLQAKDDAIATMQAAGRELLKVAGGQQKAIEHAAGQLQDYAQALVTARAALRAKEDADRDIPACQVILHADLTACPGHAGGVRERARRSLQRSTGGGAAASADAAGPAPGGGL